MHETLTYQSIKENPKRARDTNVYLMKENPKIGDILTYQSIKENPKSARDTNVSVDKRES